jgi:hypothetical protein
MQIKLKNFKVTCDKSPTIEKAMELIQNRLESHDPFY